MSEKARVALKSGKLFTPRDSAACGVELLVGKLYLITGKVTGLKAHVSLCGYVQPWRHLTSRQRKGFRLIYQRGCTCKIPHYVHHRTNNKQYCTWDKFQCQRDYGICLRSPSGQCHWSKSLELRKCIAQYNSKLNITTSTTTTTTMMPLFQHYHKFGYA